MRLFINESEPLYEMSKLTKKYASAECGDFGEFIYFSPKICQHGPRVKFYGGTKETSNTRNAPTMKFDNDGNTELGDLGNLNKKNCPNAFDSKYLKKVSDFIKKMLPILLLVWYDKMDEADALAYFHGNLSLPDLIDSVDIKDSNILNQLKESKNIYALHRNCKQLGLYTEEEL